MKNDAAFNELKSYGEKFSHLVQGLKLQQGSPKEQYSKRDSVFEKDKLKLFHYLNNEFDGKANTALKVSTPVIIVYALVNRPSILDLQQGNSAIAKMIESGLDVYLIDWGYPDDSDIHRDLNYYINDLIDSCVDVVCEKSSINNVNLMGVCQGGVLSLCYSSLYPKKVKNLVTLVTPIDFQTKADTLSNLVKHVDIDLMVNTMGNIPGDMLSSTFLSLRPYYLQLKKYLNLVDATEELNEKSKRRITQFILMERWIFDNPDQAGEAFREFVQACYQKNQLMENSLKVGGCHIDLTKLDIPVLNVFAKQDNLVPPESSKALSKFIDKDNYQEMEVTGGHIGIFVSPKSIKTLFPAIADWVWERS